MTKDRQKDAPVRSLSFKSDDFDHDLYAYVANGARLLELGLVKQTYDVKLPFFWGDPEGQLEFRHSFEGEPKGSDFDEKGVIVGGYGWAAEIKAGRKKALKLTAEYILVFGGIEGADPEYAGLYFEKIARFATYPYFRSLFAMNTANSGISLDPLPSLRERVD